MPSNEDSAWAAGFFDGEGHIGITKNTSARTFNLTLSVTQKRREPLDKIIGLFGGSCYLAHHNGQPKFWRWHLSGRKAATVLVFLLPYLIVKRQQALLAVEFQRLKPENVNSRTPDRIVEQQTEFALAILALRKAEGTSFVI